MEHKVIVFWKHFNLLFINSTMLRLIPIYDVFNWHVSIILLYSTAIWVLLTSIHRWNINKFKKVFNIYGFFIQSFDPPPLVISGLIILLNYVLLLAWENKMFTPTPFSISRFFLIYLPMTNTCFGPDLSKIASEKFYFLSADMVLFILFI